jgi:hypothetical protein
VGGLAGVCSIYGYGAPLHFKLNFSLLKNLNFTVEKKRSTYHNSSTNLAESTWGRYADTFIAVCEIWLAMEPLCRIKGTVSQKRCKSK